MSLKPLAPTSDGPIDPVHLSFGVHGKPFLPGCPAFNLCHSAEWLACAVSPRRPMGLDVEAFLRLRDYQELLASITHPVERRTIAEAEQATGAFQALLDRKKATLKANDKGLSAELCSIDVDLAESYPAVSDPPSLRLVDLPTDDDRLVVPVAVDTSVRGIVVMHVAPQLHRICSKPVRSSDVTCTVPERTRCCDAT